MKLNDALSITDSYPPLIGSDKVREALDKHGAELLQDGIVDVLRRLTDRIHMRIFGEPDCPRDLVTLVQEAQAMLEKAEEVEVPD